MPLNNDMIARLNQRIAAAQIPYQQFVYISDVHWIPGAENAGFKRILSRIASEANQTLFVYIGGDSIDNGSSAYYASFIEQCNKFYSQTSIPIVIGMGNHEYYGVAANVDARDRFRRLIGNVNFKLEISSRGLPDSLSLVVFHDSLPRKLEKIYYPDIKKNCVTKSNTKHLFYFPYSYIHYDPKAPEKFSGFPTLLDNSNGNHIIVSTHVPPRKNPLPRTLDQFIADEYRNCLNVNHVISLSELQTYYRNLWMLVHGNSTPDKNDSTQWLVDEIKNRTKVDLLLTGHVHSYYTFPLTEANHNLQVLISGAGGNTTATAISSTHPMSSRYNYIRVRYNAGANRFVTQKVDVP